MAASKSSASKARGSAYVGAASSPPFKERLFDARPDRLDLRVLPYRPPLKFLPVRCSDEKRLRTVLPGYVKAGRILDHGTEGACTGFGLACVANYLLYIRHLEEYSETVFESVSPGMRYELARRYDEWPGDRYEGLSCRGAIKGWHKHGVCAAKSWPYPLTANGGAQFVPPTVGWERDAIRRTVGVYYRVEGTSLVDVQAAIVNISAVYVSLRVHDGWDALTNTRPLRATGLASVPDIVLPKKGGKLGGHAVALVSSTPTTWRVRDRLTGLPGTVRSSASWSSTCGSGVDAPNASLCKRTF